MTIILIMLIQAIPVVIVGAVFRNQVFTTLTAIFMGLIAIATGSSGFILIDLFGIGVAYWIAISFPQRRAPSPATNAAVTATSDKISDDCFLQSLNEFDSHQTDDAAMARAMVDTDGQDAKLKSRYLHFRAIALQRIQDAVTAEARRKQAALQAEIDRQKQIAEQEALKEEAKRRRDSLARFLELYPASARLNSANYASIFEFFYANPNQTDEVARRVEAALSEERRIRRNRILRDVSVFIILPLVVVVVAVWFPGADYEHVRQRSAERARSAPAPVSTPSATVAPKAGIPTIAALTTVPVPAPVIAVDPIQELGRRAALGDSVAQLQYGLALFAARRSTSDAAVAVNIIRTSANSGNDKAAMVLGSIYAEGDGIDRDLKEAYAWLLVSSIGGNKEAKSFMDNLEKRMTPAEVTLATRIGRERYLKVKSTSARAN